MRQCVQEIEVLMASSMAALQPPLNSKLGSTGTTAYTSSSKLTAGLPASTVDSSQPNTPTDVQDVNF